MPPGSGAAGDVALVMTADGTQVKTELDSEIRALQKFGSVVDVTNATAVRAFRASIESQRELAKATGATALQMAQLDAISRKFEASVVRAADQAARMKAIPSQAKEGASALSMLAFTAAGAGGSIQSAAVAAGTMAQTMAVMSRSAAVAASASGIGALVIALGVLIGLAKQAHDALKEIPEGAITDFQQMHIQALHTVKQVEEELARARQRQAAAQEAVGRFGDQEGLRRAVNAQAYVTALINRRRELQKQERKEAEEAAKKYADETKSQLQQATDLQKKLSNEIGVLNARHESDFTKRSMAAQDAYLAEVESIRKLTHLSKKRQDELVALAFVRRKLTIDQINEEQKAANERARLEVTANGRDFLAAHQARLDMIKAERDAEIKSGIDVAIADARAQQKRDALRQSYRDAMLSDLKVIEEATIGSKSREIAAIGTLARTARKIEFGYKAAENTIDSLKEAAAAIGSAAHGDFAGAALHAMSSIKFAAAAALAAKEGGAGGGGGGGAGGAAGGGGGGPRESSRLGASLGTARGTEPLRIEFVVIQRDATGRETARTRQMIQRLEDRNQPIRMGA